MNERDCAKEVAKYIISEVKNEHIILPDDVSLEYLSVKVGYTPQLIGSAHDYSITRILKANGINSRKCGKPVILQLSELNGSPAEK